MPVAGVIVHLTRRELGVSPELARHRPFAVAFGACGCLAPAIRFSGPAGAC